MRVGKGWVSSVVSSRTGLTRTLLGASVSRRPVLESIQTACKFEDDFHPGTTAVWLSSRFHHFQYLSPTPSVTWDL